MTHMKLTDNIFSHYLSHLSTDSHVTFQTVYTSCPQNARMAILFFGQYWISEVLYTECLQMNGAVSKVNKFISHLTQAKRTPSAVATVQVLHALPAVRFSCLLRGRGVSFQDGVAAGKGFLCALFWGVQICDYTVQREFRSRFSKDAPFFSKPCTAL